MHKHLTSSSAPARAWFSLLVLIALVLLAACGNTTTTGSTAAPTATSNTTASSTTTSSRYGKGYGTGSTTPTASSSGQLIQTATVNGKAETILTTAQGMTLYYRTTDMPPATVCSGGCASAWPPLLVSGSNPPTSATSLPGKLSVQTDANGAQVEYNGHPLYTFSGDTGPGQTTGEGFGGIWHVVTPTLT